MIINVLLVCTNPNLFYFYLSVFKIKTIGFQHNFNAKRSRLTNIDQFEEEDLDNGSNLKPTIYKLRSILSHELECVRSHWVPGWYVLVRSGPNLNRLYQYVSSKFSLTNQMSHLKRIDSGRSMSNDFVAMFLNFASTRYENYLAFFYILMDASVSQELSNTIYV